MKCIKCGSLAFNLQFEGINQGDLCDVHYWQERAEALAQQEQERNFCPRCGKRLGKNDWDLHTCTPPQPAQQKPLTEEFNSTTLMSSTSPPQRTWVGLKDEVLRDVLQNTNDMIRNAMHGPFWPELEQACRAIETKLKETNT